MHQVYHPGRASYYDAPRTVRCLCLPPFPRRGNALRAALPGYSALGGGMKITGIDCHVLLIPSAHEGATDSAQDDLVVFIHTDAGITGVGESDANPWMLKAAIEAPSTHTMGMGLKDMLMGADPLDDAEAIWERLYVGTAMNGRRGLIIHAIGALDMALWDIKGKAAGKPCWELLLEPGVTPPPHVVPYGDPNSNSNPNPNPNPHPHPHPHPRP